MIWSQQGGANAWADLRADQQAALRARVQAEMRTNTYDPDTETITISPVRVQAIRAMQDHYLGLFGNDPALAELREHYAMPADTIGTAEHRTNLTAFCFWASWACVTERPGREYTYTNNWPPDELIGNRPAGQIILVSVLGFVLLLDGIEALAWCYAATRDNVVQCPCRH